MTLRKLGNSGLEVSPLAFGGNVFGWTIDEATSFRLLDEFVNAGLNLIDTADIYSNWFPGNRGGESESILGNWLKRSSKRSSVIVATKVGMEMGTGQKGLSKKYILRSADDSLKRLRTDYIDLYQSHQDDPETPLQETLEAYGTLIEQGKVRAIGASNYSAKRFSEALTISQENGLPRYESMQPLYNLYDRAEYEKELEPLCLEKDVGVITYFSLASGFLTGKYRSEKDLPQSQRGSRVKKYLNARGLRIIIALYKVARDHSTTPASVSLAWLMARPGITAPIASATNLDQLKSLIEATRITLEPADIDLLNQASAYQDN